MRKTPVLPRSPFTRLFLILFALFSIGVHLLNAQKPLPRDWEARVKVRYDRLPAKEIPFSEFLKVETEEFQRINAIESGRMTAYSPRLSASVCGNGDFESGNLDQNEWTGAYGSINTSTRDPNWPNLTDGFSSGAVTSGNARQTIVSTGADPNVGISTVHGGNYALRIGNQINGRRTELISKTFSVVAEHAVIRFWYAVVLQDPQSGHEDDERPSFWVRVVDQSDGSPISGVVNLGNPVQPDKMWADSNNDFFQTATVNNQLVNFRDWTCAEINLSGHLGKTVTVQFITEDCSQGAHFGYAYLDDFCTTSCENSPDGWITFEASDCKAGSICFSYGVPDNGSQTGTCQITLSYLQNGIPFHTQTSPVLSVNDGGQYCFQFEPCDLPGIDPDLNGFDFFAEAQFALGGATLPPKTAGSIPDGHEPGQNNDCACNKHDFEFDPCCPPMNEEFLLSLFQHVPTGSLSEPYRLTFTEDPLFKSLSQAYLDYIHLLHPEIEKLAFHWRIMEAGTGATPNGVWSASLQELYTWFLPGGGGVHHNTAPFFTATLDVGKWYWLHVGIFTDPEVDAFDTEACLGDMRLYYRADFIGGQLRGRFSDQRKVIRQRGISAGKRK